jgi:hypothetical protein
MFLVKQIKKPKDIKTNKSIKQSVDIGPKKESQKQQSKKRKSKKKSNKPKKPTIDKSIKQSVKVVLPSENVQPYRPQPYPMYPIAPINTGSGQPIIVNQPSPYQREIGNIKDFSGMSQYIKDIESQRQKDLEAFVNTHRQAQEENDFRIVSLEKTLARNQADLTRQMEEMRIAQQDETRALLEQQPQFLEKQIQEMRDQQQRDLEIEIERMREQLLQQSLEQYKGVPLPPTPDELEKKIKEITVQQEQKIDDIILQNEGIQERLQDIDILQKLITNLPQASSEDIKKEMEKISKKAGEKTRKVAEHERILAEHQGFMTDLDVRNRELDTLIGQQDDRIKDLSNFAMSQRDFTQDISKKMTDIQSEQQRQRELYEQKLKEQEERMFSEISKKSEQIQKLEKQRDELFEKMQSLTSEEQYKKLDTKLQGVLSKLDDLEEAKIDSLSQFQNLASRFSVFEQKQAKTPKKVAIKEEALSPSEGPTLALSSPTQTPSSPTKTEEFITPVTPGIGLSSPSTPEISPGLFAQTVIDTPFAKSFLEKLEETSPSPQQRQEDIQSGLREMEKSFGGESAEEQIPVPAVGPFIGVFDLGDYIEFKKLEEDITNLKSFSNPTEMRKGRDKYNEIKKIVDGLDPEELQKLESEFNKFKGGEFGYKEAIDDMNKLDEYKKTNPEEFKLWNTRYIKEKKSEPMYMKQLTDFKDKWKKEKAESEERDRAWDAQQDKQENLKYFIGVNPDVYNKFVQQQYGSEITPEIADITKKNIEHFDNMYIKFKDNMKNVTDDITRDEAQRNIITYISAEKDKLKKEINKMIPTGNIEQNIRKFSNQESALRTYLSQNGIDISKIPNMNLQYTPPSKFTSFKPQFKMANVLPQTGFLNALVQMYKTSKTPEEVFESFNI